MKVKAREGDKRLESMSAPSLHLAVALSGASVQGFSVPPSNHVALWLNIEASLVCIGKSYMTPS